MAQRASARNALKNLAKGHGFNVCSSNQLKISRLDETDLTESLLEAFESSDNQADVSVVAENQAVQFHRSILAAASPFLATTISSAQCPCQPITIIIDGCRYLDILRVKHLLYFGEVKLAEAEMASFGAVIKLLGFKVPIIRSVFSESESDVHAVAEASTISLGAQYVIETENEFSEVSESVVESPMKQRSAKQRVQGNAAAKAFTCEQCSSIFSTQVAYRAHMRNSHSAPRKRTFDEIEVIFSEDGEIIPTFHNTPKSNKEKKSSGIKLQRNCTICSLKFPMKDWDDHMAQHALKGEQPNTPLPNEYECPQCSKAFTLTWGTRVNNARVLKQLDCHLCGEKFSSVSNLRRHVRRTHSCRPHLLCDTCDPTLPPLHSDGDSMQEKDSAENEAVETENDENVPNPQCSVSQIEDMSEFDSQFDEHRSNT